MPDLYRGLGDALEKMGQMDKAQEAYRKAEELEEEVVPEKIDDSNE
ncbi:tetratricopeptide repeat protein [Planctomycetota bacterium]